MKALRCDRCGEFFSGYGNYPDVTTNPDGYLRTIYVDSSQANVDLCGKCRAELREWWNAKGSPTDVNEEDYHVN